MALTMTILIDFTILIDYGHADVVTTLIDYCVDNDKC